MNSLLKNRQSCRSFSDKPVEIDKLVACLNAACYAPSACNTQPYHFYVAHAPEAVATAAEFCKSERVNTWADEVGAFVLITKEHADIPYSITTAAKRDFREFDIGLMIENFCLEATEQGLGTCIMGVYNEDKLKEKFHIPAHKQISMVIAVGYPKESEIRKKQRKPLEEMITYLR